MLFFPFKKKEKKKQMEKFISEQAAATGSQLSESKKDLGDVEVKMFKERN